MQCCFKWRRKWQPTPVVLPGESQGRGSLVSMGTHVGMGHVSKQLVRRLHKLLLLLTLRSQSRPALFLTKGLAWKAPGSAGGAVPVPWDLRSVPSSVGQKPLEASGWIPDREV